MTEERQTIMRNAVSGYALRGLRILAVLAITPYLFRKLGLGGFGTWSVMFTVTTIFSFVEMGLAAGITKYVAEFRARGEQDQVEGIVSAGVVIFALAGVVVLAVTVAIGVFADGLAAAGEEDAFRTGMVVLGVAMLIKFVCATYWAALAGYQSFVRANLAEAVNIVGFPLGCVIALETGGGVLGVAVAYAAAMVASGVAYAVLLHSLDRGLSLRPRGVGRVARRLASFGSFTVLLEAMRLIGVRLDTVVIAAIRNAASAAPFAAASKLQSGLQSLTYPFLVLLMPMTSDLWARGDREEVARRFLLATRVALQVALPVAAGLALFAHDVVDVWLGSDAPSVTASIIVLLMIAEALVIATWAAEGVLVGIGRVRVVGLLSLAQGVSNLGVSIVLVSNHGAIGAAIGTLVTTALLSQISLPVAARAIGSSTRTLVLGSIGPALVSVLPAAGLMVLARLVMSPGLGRLVVGLGLGLIAAAVVGVSQVGLDRVKETLGSVFRPGGGEPPEERLILDSAASD